MMEASRPTCCCVRMSPWMTNKRGQLGRATPTSEWKKNTSTSHSWHFSANVSHTEPAAMGPSESPALSSAQCWHPTACLPSGRTMGNLHRTAACTRASPGESATGSSGMPKGTPSALAMLRNPLRTTSALWTMTQDCAMDDSGPLMSPCSMAGTVQRRQVGMCDT